MKKIIATILALVILSLGNVFSSADDFNADTEAAATALQHFYNKNGLWDTTGWWNAANCVEAMENVITADNGQNYLPVLANTLVLNETNNFLNEYYDDEGWWALAWIRAFDLTGKPKFLEASKTIFRDLTNGWSEHCAGGLIWRKKHTYKNAIPNELFLLAAIRLHQRTPGDGGPGSYLDWALKEWDWFKKTGMINAQNLINDGLNNRCENNGATTWTYNQGVILGGLTDLYKTTGDTNYLNQATAIADAAVATLIDGRGVLKEPCEDRGCGGNDAPQFKGIFIRYLAYLYDETRNPTYLEFLSNNARSVWANDRDANNYLGLKWSGPFDLADATRQSSAMMAISALAEPATKNLPFAKGAGSATFKHEVGAAAGTLAWTCDENNAARAGLMLSGTCATLSAGKHTVHFRMAVNEIKSSADDLVWLEVKNSAGVILAQRQVTWNLFATAGQPQDFQLTFTNATANVPVGLQVYWNHVSKAPNLTLADVTIDGSHNWTAANLAHEIGWLDGLNGWEADPIRDPVSGSLAKAAGINELPAGEYSANFELKVDNFNWDNSLVATLSIVETDTDKTIASQTVTRNQFPDTLYHAFTLDFQAEANRRYDFKTTWHYSVNAPRLTQRSLVVRPKPTY